MTGELKRKLRAAQHREVANFRMPFGEFQSMTLEEISETDRGLRYLDWIIGWDELWDSTKKIIERFLADSMVKACLAEALHGGSDDDFEEDWEHWK